MTPRHQNNTKTFEELTFEELTFEELTFEEQSKAMSMNALQFRKQLCAHLRRADQEGRPRRDVLTARLNLLQRIVEEYRDPAAVAG